MKFKDFMEEWVDVKFMPAEKKKIKNKYWKSLLRWCSHFLFVSKICFK